MSTPSELTTAVDTFVADVRALHNGMGDVAAFSGSLSTLIAVVLDKATVMAAGAVTSLARPFSGRLDQIALRLGSVEAQLQANSRFLHEIHARLDAYASRLDALERGDPSTPSTLRHPSTGPSTGSGGSSGGSAQGGLGSGQAGSGQANGERG